MHQRATDPKEELDDEEKFQIQLYCNDATLSDISFREFCNQRTDICGYPGSERRRESQYHRNNILKRLGREKHNKQLKKRIMSKYNIHAPWLSV